MTLTPLTPVNPTQRHTPTLTSTPRLAKTSAWTPVTPSYTRWNKPHTVKRYTPSPTSTLRPART